MLTLKRRYTPERIADIYVYPTAEAGTPFTFSNHLSVNFNIEKPAQ